MRWRMLFRIGLSLIIVVAVVLFYLNNLLHKHSKDKISELVRSENIAFQESLVRHDKHGEDPVSNKAGGKLDLKQESGLKEKIHNDEREVERNADGETNKGQVESVQKPHGLGDSAQTGEGGERGLSDSGGVAVVHKDSTWSGQASGLKPVHHRVGSQVPTGAGVGVGVIHLGVVACGERVEDVMVMLKSALVLTPSFPLVLHIFAERPLQSVFVNKLQSWPVEVLERVEYRLYDITFPTGEKAEDWRKLFKPCATQRLFIPSLLPDVDSLLYVDTDVLFLTPLTHIWSFFSRFNSTQLVAVAPEGEDTASGWYNRFARHPYVPPLGVNSGVMLMNLTRLRQSTWETSMVKFFHDYRLKLTWGDQDLINIYFHFHPEELYVFTCAWNYRPDHCKYMSVCKPVEQHGAFIIHCSRGVTHNDKQPAFKAVYTAFKNYQFGQDLDGGLLQSLRQHLQGASSTACGKLPHVFLSQVQRFVTNATGRSGGHPAENSNHKPPSLR